MGTDGSFRRLERPGFKACRDADFSAQTRHRTERGISMTTIARDPAVYAMLATLGTFVSTAAMGQTIQVLDQVAVSNKTSVLEMQFNDPAREFDFSVWGVAPVTGFTGCVLAPARGLFCIDGKEIRSWATPGSSVGAGDLVLSCTDRTLDLDRRRADPCTSLAVGLPGPIWLAGRDARAHRLIKVVPRNEDNSCPEGAPLEQGPYCANLYAAGRPLLEDVSAIDGDQGAAFVGPNGVRGPGVLGLEQRNAVIFFRDTPLAPPVVIASGKTQWGLSGSEQLLSATLLQTQLVTDGPTRNFAVVTTSRDRILAVDTENPGPAFEVFKIAAERLPGSAQCNFDEQRYGIRASTKSGRLYLTDRNYCQALALKPVVVAGKPFVLQNVLEDGSDLTFSTASYAPDAPTISPGTIIDLGTCTDNCTLVTDQDGAPAATLANVTLASDESGMILFQVKNVPDCRWIPEADWPAACRQPDVIVKVNASDTPDKWFLNFTPLLPREITDLFDDSGVPPKGLPRMLIGPKFRAQATTDLRNNLFELFFGVTDPAVVFTGTFDGLFDVEKLVGDEVKLGCGYDYSEGLKPNLKWHAVTHVSERHISAGGPGELGDLSNPNRHVDSLANVGCFNPTAMKGGEWSAYVYNLVPTAGGDTVLANLLVSLFANFEETRAELACTQRDTTGLPPLSPSVCSTIESQWLNAKDKLVKCLDATTQPKQSSGDQNCSAFTSQLRNIKSTIEGSTSYGPDPANRRGGLLVGVEVMLHVHLDRFLPSVPLEGFADPIDMAPLNDL